MHSGTLSSSAPTADPSRAPQLYDDVTEPRTTGDVLRLQYEDQLAACTHRENLGEDVDIYD